MKMSNIKKYFGVGMILIFTLLSIASFTTADFKQDNLSQSDKSEVTFNEITLLRVAPNGQIKPVKTFIPIEDGQDLETAITEKCQELCTSDVELQKYIKTKESASIRMEVESKGNGFHWSFRRIILANRSVLWRSVIKYRYVNPEDYTNIKIPGSENWTNLMEGPQQIGLIGFTGYVSFKPNLFWGSTIIHGYALRVEWK